MARLLALFAALLAPVCVLAASPLLGPGELNALLATPRLRVIDIRDPASYAERHIPGAVSAPYGSWRGPATNPGELPALGTLAARVQSLGLEPETHAVVVSYGGDATDFGASARVYWTLRVLGLRELSILNGGIASWSAAGLPLDNVPVKVVPSKFAPRLDESLIATREQTLAAARAGTARLVDARPPEFYRGGTRHQAAKLPGTLKGAVNVEHASWFNPGTATFVSAEEARRIAASRPIDPARETISFCNTGHWAATNWFALSEVLGQKNVRLYPGSVVDWTQAPQVLPMDNVPNRFDQLVIDWRLWVERTFE